MTRVQLVERDDELTRLRVWCTAAARGRGQVVLITGEAGIGKSALAHVVVAEMKAGGVLRAALGQCDALATPRPLGPFREVAASLGIEAAASDRDALFVALAEDVRAHGPALLVVEDVHWADGASVDLLAVLGRRVRDLPIVLVATYRDHEIGTSHPLRLVLGDLASAGVTSTLTLRPLTVQGVAVLADGLPSADGAELHELTGGNPFYVTEVIAAGGAGLPTTVRQAVVARVSRLSEHARAVLDAIAIVPGQVERWLVHALAPGSEAAVGECVAAGVLTAGDSVVAFRHELARLAVEAELRDDERRSLHARAGDALGKRGEDPARIAHHAARSGDEAALAVASAASCSAALARSAYAEAALHGRAALAHPGPLGADACAVVALDTARALCITGWDVEGVEFAARAGEHWRAAGDVHREAAARVVESAVASGAGSSQRAVDAAMRAVSLLEALPPSAALAGACVRVAGEHMVARDRNGTLRWANRAIVTAEAIGEDEIALDARVTVAVARLMAGESGAAAAVRSEIARAERMGLVTSVGRGLLNIGSGYAELRLYDEGEVALRDAIAWCATHGLDAHRNYSLAWLARCRFDRGEWTEAEKFGRESLSGTRGQGIAAFVALNTLGWLRARRGEADVWPALDGALAIARRTGHLQRLWPAAVARAEAAWLSDDLAPHVPLLEEAYALAAAVRYPPAVGELAVWLARAGMNVADAAPIAVEPFASVLRGDLDAAAEGFARLGCAYDAAVIRADGADEGALRAALATFERLGAAPMLAKVRDRLTALGLWRPADERLAATESDVATSALSAREREVLGFVTVGFTNRQIAEALYISRKTAEHHVSNILAKLGVTTRTQAAASAVRLGLFDS